MRILFILLLLLNLAFFGWAHWIDVPREVAPPRTTDPAVGILQLEPGALAELATRCRSIGPFAGAVAASAAAGVLRSHGVQPRDRTAETNTADGYWVYVGDLKDPGEQRRALARLSDAGIHDAAAMTQSDQAGRVSVGIFSDQAHAVRRAEQVRLLGFKPVLELHQRTVDQHWLDVNLKLSDPDPALTELSGGTDSADNANGVLNITDCPAKSASG